MTNQDRKFDAEAVKKEHSELIQDIEEVEQLQFLVGQGDLGFAPAFGLVSSGQNGSGFQKYAGFHETVWNNLDAVRRGMYAALASLEHSMEENGITEYENVRSLDDLNDGED